MSQRTIDDYIVDELAADDQKVALDFIAFLRSLELEFVKDNGYWKDKIYYIVKRGTRCVCFIAIKNPDEPDNRWTVWSDDMSSQWLAGYSLEQEISECAWQHVDACRNCGSCGGGKPKTIFGRRFERVCGCTFRIDNPGEAELPFMKKMVKIRIKEILSQE